ncbi:MAG: T9SS type A sorting domain-containing protein [Paludibacter sp.]
MKKITFIMALIASTLLANAQVLLDETFNYPEGNLAAESAWTTAGTLTAGTGRFIITPALTYADAAGTYALSGLGKTINSNITSSTDYLSYKAVTAAVSTGSYYLTFMFNPGIAQSQSNSEIMSFTEGSNSGAKVLVGKGIVTTTNFRFATDRGSSTSSDYKWGTTEFSDINATYLVVLKWDFATKTSSIFINPVLGSTTEPTTPESSDVTSATVRATLTGVRFRANGTSYAKFNVGGIRVSTTWAAAVGILAPALSKPTVSSATNVSNVGFTANWTAVANAVSYDVSVYQGVNLVKTINVPGQASASLAITGLASNTSYNYNVIAKGDGLNFRDSDPSVSSADLTTLGLSAPVVGDASAITENSFTAHWTAVANAASYDLELFLGNGLISTTNVDAAAISHDFTGLSMGTSYSYKVIAKGTIDSTPSASAAATTTALAVNSINTDFGDGSWGAAIPTPSTNLPANGSYPSWWANGFQINSCALYGSILTGPKGETHKNVIQFDKMAYNSMITFPIVNSVEQIEFHAYSGSDAKSIALEEWDVATSTWIPVTGSPFAVNKIEAIYTVAISRSVPTQFRLRNAVTSSMNVSQIITRTTAPVDLAAPFVNAAKNLIAGGFTASWSTVNNATGYIVSVLNYDKALNKNFTVLGQPTDTYNVVGLDSANVCTYKVAAIGDGVLYNNSVLSGASASFVLTSGLTALENPSVSSFVNVIGKTIATSEVGNIEVYNLQGAQLFNVQNVSTLKTNLVSGMYIVRFTNSLGQKLTKKLIIQ